MHLARILVHLHIVLHHKDLPDLLWVGSLLVHLAPAYTPALPLLKGSYHAKRRLGEDKVDMAESYRYQQVFLREPSPSWHPCGRYRFLPLAYCACADHSSTNPAPFGTAEIINFFGIHEKIGSWSRGLMNGYYTERN